MHELSVCYALLEQVERIARENGGAPVTRIVVRIGPLSGVEPQLLERAYPLAVAGSIAAGARLVTEVSDIIVQCNDCGASTTARANCLLCGQCGNFRTRVVSGDEMILQRVELEHQAA